MSLSQVTSVFSGGIPDARSTSLSHLQSSTYLDFCELLSPPTVPLQTQDAEMYLRTPLTLSSFVPVETPVLRLHLGESSNLTDCFSSKHHGTVWSREDDYALVLWDLDLLEPTLLFLFLVKDEVWSGRKEEKDGWWWALSGWRHGMLSVNLRVTGQFYTGSNCF